MTAAAYLKANTRDLHLATEQALHSARIRSKTLTLGQYREVLNRHLSVWTAVATSLPATVAPEDIAFVQTLGEALQRDQELHQLKLPTEARPPDAPPVRGAGWGSCYVLRGSTLGGTMISRLLPACPELSHLPRFHFYEACADLPRRHWPDFLSRLERTVTSQQQLATALAEARWVFGGYL